MVDAPAIEARGLRKSFRHVTALDGVDLTVPPGVVHGLLGPNGAGKTTAVRILATLLRADAGSAAVAGYDVRRDGAAVRSRIGLTGQYAAVDPFATGRENLRQAARLHHLGRDRGRHRIDELIDRLDLTAVADRRASTYSGGTRRRLDLAVSLIGAPPVLLLDEPTTGLDPRARHALWEIVADLAATGTCVLLSTQYLDEADKLADTVTVLDRGRVIATGRLTDLKNRIGGGRLRLQPASSTDGARLAAALAGLAAGEVHTDTVTGEVTVADATSDTVVEALRTAAEAHITIVAVALAQPTLDDVFLAVTAAKEPLP